MQVFLGFGCLMTFLRRYSYSAIAFNFFISCFVMLYSVLILGLFSQVWHRSDCDCYAAAAGAFIWLARICQWVAPCFVSWIPQRTVSDREVPGVGRRPLSPKPW